jgi:peptidoglycan hydrolase-like protein with peptidoglycan-binding domain/3D (Asp-Asp-Asp) domain-containing protein
MQINTVRLSPAAIVIASMALSLMPPVATHSHWGYSEKMLVTAYYTPLANQTHYYLGSYEEDIRFNGSGISADGTKAYPGMIAAPKEIPFGTRIEIPAHGVVGTVRDRGGRINMTEGGIHHIDIWLGEGEEGLARALEWGARIIDVVVYEPLPSSVPSESFDLALFDAPETAFKRMPSNPSILVEADDPTHGESSTEVAAVQHALKKLGYFDHDITSYFGDVTLSAIREFQQEANLTHRGEKADEETRNAIVAHMKLFEELEVPLPEEDSFLQGTTGKDIRVLQRVLKILLLYHGEIDGMYDQELMGIIYTFQKNRGIVNSLAENGAGIVGEKTLRALITAWRAYRIEKRGGAALLVASL